MVGNNAYEEAPLGNPVSDARLIADTLRVLGFEVSTVRDADEDEMEEAIVRLGERLREFGPQAVGLFYYAGHGLQSSAGRNFLIPVGAAIGSESRLAAKAVSADWVLDTMRNAGNAVNVLILDACRNNPYVATRGARGLGGHGAGLGFPDRILGRRRTDCGRPATATTPRTRRHWPRRCGARA